MRKYYSHTLRYLHETITLGIGGMVFPASTSGHPTLRFPWLSSPLRR